MKTNTLVGIALLVVGILLLFFGYQSSQGLDDRISEALTGEYTDSTLIYWIAGGVCVVLGAVLTVVGRK